MSFYVYSGDSYMDDFKILKRDVSNFFFRKVIQAKSIL